MQDRSTTWLDDRLAADDTWTAVGADDGAVLVDDSSVDGGDAVGGVEFSNAAAISTDAGGWLDGLDLAAHSVPAAEPIVITDADLDGAPEEIAVDGGVDALASSWMVAADPVDELTDAVETGGIVDPFDVYLAETAEVAAAEASGFDEPATDDPVLVDGDPGGPDLDASTESQDLDATTERGGDAGVVPTEPAELPRFDQPITSGSRLDAFDVFDEHDDHAGPVDPDPSVETDTDDFGTDFE